MGLPLYGIAALHNDDNETVNVPIEKTDEDERRENNPRNLICSPIMCYYSNSTFSFLFYETFEEITIRIENATTGEQWDNFANPSESFVRIPTSSSAGAYYIFIYTDTGLYTGAFQKLN